MRRKCPALFRIWLVQSRTRDETVSGCFKMFPHLGSSGMKIHHHNEEGEAAVVMTIVKSAGKNVLAWAHRTNSHSSYDVFYFRIMISLLALLSAT